MIKFFRKIRYDLMGKNQTGKYLKYAIGEIVLVMVGILLALQVSNWNEKRKQDANFDKLIDALENEIIENIHEANHEIDWARTIQMNSSKIQLNQISREEFLKDPNLRSVIDLNRLDINSDDISSLVKRQEDFPEAYKVLIPHLKNYLKIEDRYQKQEIEYGTQVEGYLDFLIKTQPWYASSIQVLDSIAINKQVDFYLENPVFKNYLASYNEGYRYLLREMIGIRSSCLVILAEIKRIREYFEDDDIKALFEQYHILPYSKQDCDDIKVSMSDFNEPPTYLPLINFSDEIINIQWHDFSINLNQNIQLKPGELRINPVSKRLHGNALIDIIFNGECATKYQAKRNGYLLIQ